MINRPRALVLEAPGINCNEETAYAIEQAGGSPEQVHISQLLSGERRLSDFSILALSGGFSYGDTIRSGAILGQQLKTEFAEELNDFVKDERPIIGICNGFQTLVETGLLPGGKIDPSEPKTTSLIHNENGKFEARWVSLAVFRSACRFVRASEEPVELPVAHAEGRLVTPEVSVEPYQKAFMYVGTGVKTWWPTAQYPENPNGTVDATTGVTDPSGVVLGMMPHPERYVTSTQHPNWRREDHGTPYGAVLFKGLVDYAKSL